MYSYKFGDEETGKARLEGVDASYKDLAAVCSNIRGKSSSDALALLEKASTGDFPILYRKYNKHLAHRKELGGKQGRYPKKSAKIVLGVLKNAIASAKAKSLSEDLIVVHAAANKKNVYPRLSPKGRRSRSYFETARVEIVVKERVPAKKIEKKEVKPAEKAKAEAKPKPLEAEPATNIEAKPAFVTPAAKVEAKPEAKPAAARTEAKPKEKVEVKSEAKGESKPAAAAAKPKAAPAKKAEKKGE